MEGNPTVQDVLQRFYPKYLGEHTPNARQAKSVVHILNCKTGAYGVNVSRCGQCALWDLKQPEQAQADPHMQESGRLP